MTGRYPFRTGIIYPQWCGSTKNPASDKAASELRPQTGYLSTNEIGIANVLSQSGYRTAFGGKWNQRFGIPSSSANDQPNYGDFAALQRDHLKALGFQDSFGCMSVAARNGQCGTNSLSLIGNTVDYYPPQTSAKPVNEAYYPDYLNQWAVDYIKDHSASGTNSPFFLTYSLGLIHDSKDTTRFPGQAPPPPDATETNQFQIFADKMAYADKLIGNILDAINNDESLSNNTLILIAGDNGTEMDYTCDYKGTPICGGKLGFTSHGSRVPFMARWNGTIEPGTATGLAEFADVFATLVDLAGAQSELKTLASDAPSTFSDGHNIDGISFKQMLFGGPSKRDFIFSQMLSGGFVANKSYQLRINTKANSQNTCKPIADGFYNIEESPKPDKFLSATRADLNPEEAKVYDSMAQFFDQLSIPTNVVAYRNFKLPSD